MREKPFNNIGNLIKAARKAQGMSQMALAEKVGVSYQQIQKYEKGTSTITITRLALISKALGIPAEGFFSVEPTILKNPTSGLSPKELRLLMLFRKIKSNKAKDAILTVLEDVAEISLHR